MARVLLISLLIVNVFDVVIHVAADRVEPVRVTSNVLVILASVVALFARTQGAGPAAIAAGGVAYAALNGWFILSSGIGNIGLVLIVSTVILATLFVLRHRAWRNP